MKKVFTVFLFLIGISATHAQINAHHTFQDNSGVIEPSLKNAKNKNLKELLWNWDTIITYDTLNFLRRETRVFDNNGKEKIHYHDDWNDTAWSKRYKDSLIYDVNGNLIIELQKLWGGNNVWIDHIKNTYTYNSHGQNLTHLFEEWHNNILIKMQRWTFTYDVNGNMLTNFREDYLNNQWTNYDRYTYTYDGNGNTLTYLKEIWQNNAWQNVQKSTSIYDFNNNLLTTLYEYWQNNSWINTYKHTYTYDMNGNMLAELAEIWQSNAFINYNQWSYSYNINGELLTALNLFWQNNVWQNGSRYSYTYDGNGNLLIYTREFFLNNQWQNDNRYTYSYDLNGNRLTNLWQYWDSTSFVNIRLWTYTYDGNGNSISGKLETWNIDHWAPWDWGEYLQVISNNEVVYDIYGCHKYEASFVYNSSGINQYYFLNNLTIFPNPSTGFINITFAGSTKDSRVNVINSLGQLILTNQINTSSTTLDLTNHAKGMYFIKVQSGNGVAVRKVIIE